MFFYVISFFPNYYGLPGNSTFNTWFRWYALDYCFNIDNYKVFQVIIQNLSFRCLLKSIKLVSFSYSILISKITIGK